MLLSSVFTMAYPSFSSLVLWIFSSQVNFSPCHFCTFFFFEFHSICLYLFSTTVSYICSIPIGSSAKTYGRFPMSTPFPTCGIRRQAKNKFHLIWLFPSNLLLFSVVKKWDSIKQPHNCIFSRGAVWHSASVQRFQNETSQ